MRHDYHNTPLAQRMRRFRRFTLFVMSLVSSLCGGALFAVFAYVLLALLPVTAERKCVDLMGSLAMLLLWVAGIFWYRQRKKIAYREKPVIIAAFLLGYIAVAIASTFAS